MCTTVFHFQLFFNVILRILSDIYNTHLNYDVHALDFYTEEVPEEYPEDEFNCEELYTGTSACEMRKAWLCDYARWRWTTLSNWLEQFENFR